MQQQLAVQQDLIFDNQERGYKFGLVQTPSEYQKAQELEGTLQRLQILNHSAANQDLAMGVYESDLVATERSRGRGMLSGMGQNRNLQNDSMQHLGAVLPLEGLPQPPKSEMLRSLQETLEGKALDIKLLETNNGEESKVMLLELESLVLGSLQRDSEALGDSTGTQELANFALAKAIKQLRETVKTLNREEASQ